jgi:hypothetical protein
MMFHVIDEYLLDRFWISMAAIRNHDQCRKTSIPEKRKRRIARDGALGMCAVYCIPATLSKSLLVTT